MNRLTKPPAQLYHPKHWPTWIGVGFLWLTVKCLPRSILATLGKSTGTLMRWALPQRKRIVSRNLELCFPELSAASRRQLVKHVFHSLGISFFETGLAWWLSDQQIDERCEIQGLNHLQEAQQTGRPVILCTGHFSCFEIAGRALSHQISFNAIYRQQKNPVYNWLMVQRRQTKLPQMIDRKDVSGLLKSLKARTPIWLAPDQDYGRKRSVFVPFFGIEAATITSPSKLAKLTNALIVPYFPYRKADLSYVVEIKPALSNFPSGDFSTDAKMLNQLFEEAIRRAPEQYFWLHRRFKTRPRGQPKLY